MSLDVDCLVLLDVDRTLFRSDDFNEAVRGLAATEFGISAGTMLAAQEEAEKKGSFYPVDWIEQQLGDEKFHEFVSQFLQRYRDEDFLYDDARELLEGLGELHLPAVAMTHGGRTGQLFKLLVSKLGLPYLIIDEPNKGERLQQWYDPATGRYTVVTDDGTWYRARGFVLIDDKNRNFAGLDADAPRALCIHVEERARSGNDAKPEIKVEGVANLTLVRGMIRSHLQNLQEAA